MKTRGEAETTVTVTHTIQVGIDELVDVKTTKVFDDTASIGEIKDWIAQELNEKKHQEFFRLVREYIKILDGGPNGVGSATELRQVEAKIRKHLAAFTSRELESLPFKD